jgi:GR25 family glycosyltransferase involved in LPS biosynthesis
MQYKNFFSDAYYINLDHRTDRREGFERRAAAVGLVPHRMPGVVFAEENFPPGIAQYYSSVSDVGTENWKRSRKKKCAELGCAYSHVAVIEDAKRRGLQNVLVFEDDCVFLDTWNQHIDDVVGTMRSLDDNWDLLYFGGEFSGDVTVDPQQTLGKISGGLYCLHAYAINSRFYDTLLQYDPDRCAQIDVLLVNSNSTTYFPIHTMAVQQAFIASDITLETVSTSEQEQIARWNKKIHVHS